ncbi:hypothetical protein GGR50DRAFT_200197 [Xylaria sp. CBS 124048]|nr:hypothetical protein GGR50DRAFT_200197 [Xylaria sp. CBS 124048]
MMYWHAAAVVIAVLAGSPSWVAGQESGWIENQINTTMCAWKELRGTVSLIFYPSSLGKWPPGAKITNTADSGTTERYRLSGRRSLILDTRSSRRWIRRSNSRW